LSRPDPALRRRARRIIERLHELYPEAECELEHRDPFQLLIATILSAQTTDKAVNKSTPALFARFPDPPRLAAAEQGEIEALIASIGLYRNKARSIRGAARGLIEEFGGVVPRPHAELQRLPGVGRKTANVVLASAFGLPALAVDTHVTRLSGRLGLSERKDPLKIEKDLTALLQESEWGFASHALIWHGRRVCAARAPRCGECALHRLCPSSGG